MPTTIAISQTFATSLMLPSHKIFLFHHAHYWNHIPLTFNPLMYAATFTVYYFIKACLFLKILSLSAEKRLFILKAPKRQS